MMAKTGEKVEPRRLYLGVDIGGTKVQASLVEESGRALERQRCRTPRDSGSEGVLRSVETAIEDVLVKGGVAADDLTAIGIAVPGVVDPDAGRVIVTPNMSLSGVEIGAYLQSKFRVPIAVGNDCNLGALGEKWLGSARQADSVVAILLGTGIGGGFVQKGKLWRGARESAGEIGHIVMQIDGPLCGCGNRGCFEALASRTAIERDLREAIAEGRESVLSALTKDDSGIIRSGTLRRALALKDPLVTDVMRRATKVLGHACLTVRHLIDPDVIVLGGGVIEACCEFMMPIVEEIVASDQLPGAREGGRVLLSALDDDAVVIGAVALARRLVGRSPFKKAFYVPPQYRKVSCVKPGEITIGNHSFNQDVDILVSGKVKKRKDLIALRLHGDEHLIGPEQLDKVCRGGPAILMIGTGESGDVALTDSAQRYLHQRAIESLVATTPEAVDAYNKSKRRRALMLRVS